MMTTENKKPNVSIAEVLIATGIKLAQEQEMRLAELIGHFQIATFEVFNRNVQAAAALNQPSSHAEGADTQKPEVSSPTEGEDKAES